MAYLALYRLFRPTTLDGLVRQEHIVKVLKNQIETDKVGHAYLFCGPRGTGKTSTAKIFAKAVNCEHPVNGSPCGKCDTCKALADPSNLDIVEIDAASNNGVNEMRDLREKVQYPPISCKHKVYIIDEVHMLTDSAFNALLKTLEEPPKHIIFILATTEAHKIPATILSRCMRFDFKLIPQEDIENLIKKIFKQIGKEYEDEAVSAIARAGEGSVRDALSVADICVSYSKGKLTYSDVNAVLGSADFFETSKLCNAILSADSSNALNLTEKILGEGKGVGLLVKDIISYLNNCSITKMCKNGNDILKLPKEMFEEIVSSTNLVDEHRFLRIMQIFSSVDAELKYSISPKIVLETAIIKASMPQKDYDIESLLARIDSLEKAISTGITVKTVSETISKAKPVVKSKANSEDSFDDLMDEPCYDIPPVPEEECGFIGFNEVIKQEEVKQQVQKKVEAIVSKTPTNSSVKGNVFGEFLKALRMARNPKCERVRMICEDAEHYIDNGKLVILLEFEGAFKTLQNYNDVVKDILQSIGIEDYEIKFKGAKDPKIDEDIEKLKSELKDFDIKIK